MGGLSFQPAELAKLVVVLFLAYHLERKADRVNEFLPSLFPALEPVQPTRASGATIRTATNRLLTLIFSSGFVRPGGRAACELCQQGLSDQ